MWWHGPPWTPYTVDFYIQNNDEYYRNKHFFAGPIASDHNTDYYDIYTHNVWAVTYLADLMFSNHLTYPAHNYMTSVTVDD